jgi:hypothetical protein
LSAAQIVVECGAAFGFAPFPSHGDSPKTRQATSIDRRQRERGEPKLNYRRSFIIAAADFM